MVLFDTHKLADFKERMYSTLLYKHYVVSSNKKLIEFKDDEDGTPISPLSGFLALKGDKLYLLQGNIKDDLPIKIHDDLLTTRVTKNGDVVYIIPYNTPEVEYYTSFRIVPARMMSYEELLKCSDQIHSLGDEFTLLYGNILYTAMCSRINLCLAGNVSSGKSSFPDCLHNIYDCIPRIEKPSTAPALAPGVSTTGVLLVDELSGLKTKESKVGVETVLNSLASGSNTISFGTAGSKAYRTKNPPPTNYLSSVIIYNKFGARDDAERDIDKFPFKASYWKRQEYFDWMWSNQASLVDRYLRMLMPDGKLDTEQFLNNGRLTEEEITLLKRMAKTKAYFQEVARTGFTESVCGLPPELTDDDVQFIMDYIKNELKVGSSSRYLSTLLELLKFSLVASNKDRDKFRWYADNYKKWIENYQKMINLENADSFEQGMFKPEVEKPVEEKAFTEYKYNPTTKKVEDAFAIYDEDII